MKITTPQAAQILGISRSTVLARVRAGALKDYGVTAQGSLRHDVVLDDQEVRAYKRTLRGHATGNGAGDVAPALPTLPLTPPTPTMSTPLTSLSRIADELGTISTRLTNLENKLDALLAVWN